MIPQTVVVPKVMAVVEAEPRPLTTVGGERRTRVMRKRMIVKKEGGIVI